MALRTALDRVSPNWEKVPVSVNTSPLGSMVMITPSVEVPVAGSPDKMLVIPIDCKATVLASAMVSNAFVSAPSVRAQFVNTNRLMVCPEWKLPSFLCYLYQ